MFYVMSATSLQDNTTNSEMKAIAFQYGLNLSDDCLPCGSDETGSDLLQILKNLSDIGQRYSYDMNSGVLIEKRPADGTNRIATIDSHELASSLQQHGLGIVTHGTKIAYALLWKVSWTLGKRNDFVCCRSSLAHRSTCITHSFFLLRLHF